MGRRRQYGTIRRLASGRYQARYRDPATNAQVSLGTFDRKADADLALAQAQGRVVLGHAVDPRRGRVHFGDYAARWLEHPPRELRPKTREGYEVTLRRHILPTFARVELSRIDATTVRSWYSRLAKQNVGDAARAKAYRLLRAILNTAVDEELIVRNPCRLRGAGADDSGERPVATVAQVYEVAAAIDRPYRALVLVAGFCSLREGELFALRRRDVDLLHGTIHVERQVVELRTGERVFTEPKTLAGKRTVAVPPPLLGELEAHLARYADVGPDGLMFPASGGGPLSASNFRKRHWRPAVSATTLPLGFRFHDLRHTGATLAAATGASTAELMARLGHKSARAALIYQHATSDRDRAIADALGVLLEDVAPPEPSAPVTAIGEARGRHDGGSRRRRRSSA